MKDNILQVVPGIVFRYNLFIICPGDVLSAPPNGFFLPTLTTEPWTYTWSNLPKYDDNGAEIEYKVVETSAKIETDREDGGRELIETGTVINANLNEGTHHLVNKLPKTSFDILKVKADGMTETLTGAIFKHEKQNDDESWSEVDAYKEIEVNSEGKASIEELVEGVYRLTETKAPDGFNMLSAPIGFTVENGKATFETSDTVVYVIADNTLKIGNTPGTQLPSTGGSGTMIYTIVGAFLIALAGVLLVSRRKRKV